jgi:ribose transport system ATP-binding protein
VSAMGATSIGESSREKALLVMRGICKAFGGLRVLDQIAFACRAGEVHALCGENGAGKSTLMKILSGAFPADEGEIFLGGQPQRFEHPAQARAAGIGIIHQELSLLPHRTVAENIYLGHEPSRGGIVDRARMAEDARGVLRRLGASTNPHARAGDLTIAEQQMVEIAKALAVDARLLVFDEPTAPLDGVESEKLFRVIAELRASGVAIIYISHRMREVFEIADRITVLKDGRGAGTIAAGEATPDAVIRLMVGRPISDLFPPRAGQPPGEPVVRVAGGGNAVLSAIDLTLRAGEVLGVAGLEGSGKMELARAIYGDLPFVRGTVTLWDGPGPVTSPREAARRGIAFLPDDRKTEGLGLRQSLRDNAVIVRRGLAAPLSAPSRGNRRPAIFDALFRKVEMRAADAEAPVGRLSGGNQQKVIVARWLATAPRLWIVGEPTRGIDVGAKAAIYSLLRDYAESGGAVLMISSDLTEIIGLSDRILVMGAGRILAELPGGASEESIMAYAVHGPVEVMA